MVSFSQVTMFGLIALAPYVQGQAAGVCARNYTVKPGDFCDLISANQNSSTYQLATVNSAIINPLCTNLFVGETICLGLVGHDCNVTSVVQAGSGCDVITATAGITFDVLRGNNPNVDELCSNIYPGEVLCTAATVITPQ